MSSDFDKDFEREYNARSLGVSEASTRLPAASGGIDDFVERYGPAAVRAAEQTGNDPALYLAQWGLETGWGKSVIPGTNNLGNIKDFSGSGVQAKDNQTGSRDKYRKYESPEQFADDFAGLLNRRYGDAVGVGSDVDAFANGLKRGGYAEDARYVDKIKAAYGLVSGRAVKNYPKDEYSEAFKEATGYTPASGEEIGTVFGGSEVGSRNERQELQAAADESPISTSLKRGMKGLAHSAGLAVDNILGDSESAAQRIAEKREFDRDNPAPSSSAKFASDWDSVAEGDYAGMFATVLKNPTGSFNMMLEQTPNSLPGMAFQLAAGIGSKGLMALGPVGAVAGVAIQGLAAFAGNFLPEGGAFIEERLHKDGVDTNNPAAVKAWIEENRGENFRGGATKAGVISSVDAVTGWMGMKMMAGPSVRFAKAEKGFFDSNGINITDGNAIKAARSSDAYKAAMQPYAADLVNASEGFGMFKRGLGATALDSVGEGVGEYAGSYAATGEASAKEAILEGLMSVGQATGMAAGQYGIGKLSGPNQGIDDLKKIAAAPVQQPNSPLSNSANITAANQSQVQTSADSVPPGFESNPTEEIAGLINQRDGWAAEIYDLQNAIESMPDGVQKQSAQIQLSNAIEERDTVVRRLQAAQAFAYNQEVNSRGKPDGDLFGAKVKAAQSANDMSAARQQGLMDEEGGEYQGDAAIQQQYAQQQELQSLIDEEKKAQEKQIRSTWLDQHIKRATQGPTHNFAGMVEYENFLKQELGDVAQRRAEAKVTNNAAKAQEAQAAEERLKDIARQIEEGRDVESAQKRNALLDAVLASNPQNPLRAFDRALRLDGFNDLNFSDDEKAKIQRFNELRQMQGEQEAAVPNEAGDFGIPERKDSPQQGKFQEVANLLNSGWKLEGKQLVSPAGQRRNLKAGELQYVRNKLSAKKPVAPKTGESNVAEPSQMAETPPQANDAQVGPEQAAAPAAEGRADSDVQGQQGVEPSSASAETSPDPVLANEQVSSAPEPFVERKSAKPISQWTAAELQARLDRGNLSDESRATIEAELAKRPAEKKPDQGKGLTIGHAPGGAEPITVRNGVVYIGDYPVIDYETEEDVRVPNDATPQQVADAIRQSGQLGGRKIYGLPPKKDLDAIKRKYKGKSAASASDQIVRQFNGKISDESLLNHPDIDVVDVSFDGIDESDVGKMQADAHQSISSQFADRGGYVINVPSGVVVTATKKNINHAVNLRSDKHRPFIAHFAVAKKIAEIIESGVVADGYISKKDSGPFTTIRRLFGAVNINGKTYRVKVTLKQSSSEELLDKAAWYYDHELTTIEEITPAAGVTSQPEVVVSKPEAKRESGGKISVRDLLAGVKRDSDGSIFFGSIAPQESATAFAEPVDSVQLGANAAQEPSNGTSYANIADSNSDFERGKAMMGEGMDKLIGLLGGKTNMLPDEEAQIIPIMSQIFRGAALMGYAKFKEASRFVMDTLRSKAPDVADKIDIDNLQAGYINAMKSIPDASSKAEIIAFDSIEQLFEERDVLNKRIEAAEDRTALNPTEAQKKSGNYVKGKFPWNGMTISIETPKGAERSGVGEDGQPWSITAPTSYGYFLGTTAADNEHLDVYIGDKPESDRVYVINQTKVDSTKFDEHKVLAGFDSEEDAKAAYFGAFTDGFADRVFGSISGPYSVEEFKSLLPKMEKASPVKDRITQKSDRIVEEEKRKYEATVAKAKAKEAERSIVPLAQITVIRNAEIDGQEVEYDQKADEALAELDKQMTLGKQLLECLAA